MLLSDLFEGGDGDEMLRRAAALARSGVTVIALLALSDEGAPAYDASRRRRSRRARRARLRLHARPLRRSMGAALAGRDIADWAAAEGIRVERAATG